MIAAVLAWFARPVVKYVAAGLAVLALIGAGIWTYGSILDRGKREGESQVIEGVQQKTIEAQEKARTTKEKADETVRTTPYRDNVDSLR